MAGADILAERLRQAGLSAKTDFNTLREYMIKVRIYLGEADCGYLCVYGSNRGTKYRTHEMKGPDLKDVIEACWNDRVDVARALLGLVEGAEVPAFDMVAHHAYVVSRGLHDVSSYAIAVTSNDEFGGYVEGAIRGSRLEAEAAGVLKLLGRCARKGVDCVVVHAGVELLKLAAGMTTPTSRDSRKFVALANVSADNVSGAKGSTCEVVWLPLDEASKGYRSALRRADSVYDERWFETA